MHVLMHTLYRALAMFSFGCFVIGVVLLGVAGPVGAACDPKTQQQVSIPLEGGTTCVAKDVKDLSQNSIVLLLKTIIQVLAIGVGIAVTIGLVVGGIMIGSARGNANQVQQGIATARNALIGLLLYIFMFAIINFVVPGGILS